MLNGYLADAHPLLPHDGSEHTALADIVMAAHELSTEIFSGGSSEWNITRDSKGEIILIELFRQQPDSILRLHSISGRTAPRLRLGWITYHPLYRPTSEQPHQLLLQRAIRLYHRPGVLTG